MLNRQSESRSGVWQAFKSLSATANKSPISGRLVLCSLSHPNWSQSCKLILVADQKNLRAGHNARKEVLALCKFTTELLGSINGGVHFPSEISLRLAQCAGNIAHREMLANHHNVHIAARRFAASCHGAVNERNLNPSR
jgi:hypothetical protein